MWELDAERLAKAVCEYHLCVLGLKVYRTHIFSVHEEACGSTLVSGSGDVFEFEVVHLPAKV